MILGGLDIATTTGAAVLKEGLYTTETFRYPVVKKKSILDVDEDKQKLDANELGKVFQWFGPVIRIWLIKHGITEVAIEQPLPPNFEGRKKAVVDLDAGFAGKAIRYERKGGTSLQTVFKTMGLEAIACGVCASLNVPVRFVNQGTWRKDFLGNGKPNNAKELAVKMCKSLGIEVSSPDAAEAVGICWWLDKEVNPYTHRRANDLFAPKPLTRAQVQIQEAEKLFKAGKLA